MNDVLRNPERSEPLSNVGSVCSEHAPKPGKYAGQEAKQFVGKIVKMGFKAFHPYTGRQTIEHMWVKVTRVDQNSLVGKLDNEPILVTEPYVQLGDIITLTVDQIEDVVEE